MCDKVQEIIDAFNLLSPENQSIFLECANNTYKAENSAKNSVACTPGQEGIPKEFHGEAGKKE